MPRSSMRLSTLSTSTGPNFAIGREPIYGNTKVSKVQTALAKVAAASFFSCSVSHSRAMASKVLECEDFSICFFTLGSTPLTMARFASSRSERACCNVTCGYTPRDSSFSRASKWYLSRHHREPLGLINRYSPSPSPSLYGLSRGSAERSATWVSLLDGIFGVTHFLPKPVTPTSTLDGGRLSTDAAGRK